MSTWFILFVAVEPFSAMPRWGRHFAVNIAHDINVAILLIDVFLFNAMSAHVPSVQAQGLTLLPPKAHSSTKFENCFNKEISDYVNRAHA